MFYIAILPDTTYGRTFAHAIMSIGMINHDYNEVSDSYGKNSPGTDWNGSAFYVNPSGNVDNNYLVYSISYGRIIAGLN